MARERNLSPWSQWMLRLREVQHPDPCPVDDPGAVPAWHERSVRARLADRLGPDPAPVPLDVECREEVDLGRYTRHSIVFDTESTMSVPAFLCVPHDRDTPGPAILALHGHGPGKSEVCGLDDPASQTAIAEHHGDYGHQLAERGYVVLAPDLRMFGERVGFPIPGRYGCDLNLVHAYAAGENPLAQNLWDLRRALDVLAEHPAVDPDRLGAVGFSYGATCTLFLAAIDARVRAAVVSCYFCTWQASHQLPANLCGSQVLPGMLNDLDHVDLGGLVAPRALLIESGREDLAFPADAAAAEVTRLATVYDALGAPDRLEHDVFDGGHQWHGARVDAFLARALGAPA